jgi:acetolactate synthase I/II/III large subunit
MSAIDPPIKRKTTGKLKRDTLVSFAPDHATQQKSSCDSSIPVADVHLNRPLDILPCSSSQQSTSVSVASAIAKMLEDMGVQYAFDVSGGAIAPLWHALQYSDLHILHFRHEAGAAFAATEAYFASGCPVVAFTTTGLGITNALTTQIFLHGNRNFTMLPLYYNHKGRNEPCVITF